MFTNERLFTIQAFTITRVHCISTYSSVPNRRACTIVNFEVKSLAYMTLFGTTGCKSDIWKKVQVNIYHIHTARTVTNDTSAKSP